MTLFIATTRRWVETHGPLGLSFAAGAMLFVISHEIIPETHHQKGHETVATVSLMIGFIVMMMFDTMLA